jgi:hypothetical protein
MKSENSNGIAFRRFRLREKRAHSLFSAFFRLHCDLNHCPTTSSSNGMSEAIAENRRLEGEAENRRPWL